MANTYKAIATVEVGSGGAASMEFTSIPQTYTDLQIMISAKSTENDYATSLRCYFNDDTANINVRELRGINATVASYAITYAQAGYLSASWNTSNTFGTASIYIPNYTSTTINKSSSADVVSPSNTAAYNVATLSARLWSSTAAVTKITLLSGAGNWIQYSTATLYGIKKD